MIGAIETFNRQLFLSMNASLETSGVVLGVAQVIANGLIFLIPLLLAALWIWGNETRRSLTLKATLVAIVGLAVNELIGLLWFHPRPLALPLGNTFFTHELNASFPSSHATVFATVGFVLLQGETRLFGWVVLIVGIFVGWARIFLGVHFPIDMLGAIVVSFAACWGASILWNKIGKAMTGHTVHLYRVVLAPVIARGWIRS